MSTSLILPLPPPYPPCSVLLPRATVSTEIALAIITQVPRPKYGARRSSSCTVARWAPHWQSASTGCQKRGREAGRTPDEKSLPSLRRPPRGVTTAATKQCKSLRRNPKCGAHVRHDTRDSQATVGGPSPAPPRTPAYSAVPNLRD